MKVIFMNSLANRIQKALDYAGLAWSAAALKLNFSAQAASNWKRGKIGKDTLKRVAHLTGVNAGWLLDGTGEMVSNNEPSLDSSEVHIAIYADGDPIPEGHIALDYYSDIYAAAGNGYLNIDNPSAKKMIFDIETLKSCNVNYTTAKVIKVRGESMLPELIENQTIAIDTSAKKIYDGEIYAFQVAGDTKVKYLFNWNNEGVGGFKAVSRNEDKIRYPDEYYSPTRIEAENINIIGQYWWKAETRRIRR